MKKIVILVGVAAMASSMPAIAEPGKSGGNGGGGGKAAHSGGGKAGGAKQADRGGGNRQAKASERGGAKAQGGKRMEQARKQERGRSSEPMAASRRNDDRKSEQRRAEGNDRGVRVARQERRWDDRRDLRQASFGGTRGDCPPGLAKKDNGCMPPGQAKKVYSVGERWYRDRRNDAFRSLLGYRSYGDDYFPSAYRSFYRDTPDYSYRYDESGYIYRVNRENNLISGLIPLLGGGFGVGEALPAGYNLYNVPNQYRSTYFDTDQTAYRYGGNAIYQVDPRSNMITNVAALLAPNTFAVGQPLPVGYDMYNVPYQYRDQYADTDQSNYRYANGNIYQVDPTTQLVTTIISAIL